MSAAPIPRDPLGDDASGVLCLRELVAVESDAMRLSRLPLAQEQRQHIATVKHQLATTVHIESTVQPLDVPVDGVSADS